MASDSTPGLEVEPDFVDCSVEDVDILYDQLLFHEQLSVIKHYRF